MRSLDLISQMLGRWRRMWEMLGNTSRSGDYIPSKGESLFPVPAGIDFLISEGDAHSEDRKMYSPLLNGKIRGNVFEPSAAPSITNGGTTAVRVQCLAAGVIGLVTCLRETGGVNSITPAIVNTDAVPGAANTIWIGASIAASAGSSANLPFGPIMGPAYITGAAGNGIAAITIQPCGQVAMS